MFVIGWLHDERLTERLEKISNGGLLFIDEKSMTGQKTFTVVRKRLQETRPNYKDKSFADISWGRQAAATNLRFSAIQSKCRLSQRIQHIGPIRFWTMRLGDICKEEGWRIVIETSINQKWVCRSGSGLPMKTNISTNTIFRLTSNLWT